MSRGLLVIKKRLDGEEFSNTYGLEFTEPGFDDTLTPAALEAFGALQPVTDGNTSSTGIIAPFIIHRTVAFDRLLTHTSVEYIEAYITDGTRNEEDDSNVFYTAALDFLGLWSSANPVPGSITLMIQRIPSGFSSRKGRLYMRGALDESEVRFGGNSLITWQTGGARSTVIARVNNAVVNSTLDEHIGGPDTSSTYLIIPHFTEIQLPDDKVGRNLTGGTPISRLLAFAPASRQVKKGRKEKKANG